MLIGYARTSTIDWKTGLEPQLIRLENQGCTKVFKDMASSIGEREQLENAINLARSGDVFVVCRLDRLARNVKHLLDVTKRLEWKGVTLKILDVGLDTSTETGKLMLTMLVAIAQFERDMMIERQREGVACARPPTKYRSRQPKDQLMAIEVYDDYNNEQTSFGT